MHGAYSMMVRNFARRARTTRDSNAFGLYRGAFATYMTADSAYIISDSHTALSGDTVDNKETGAFSPSVLETLIQKLYEQKAQDGVIDGHLASVILCPPALYPDVTEAAESALQVNTAENQLNIFSAKYNLYVATSPYLGAAAGGSDTAFFVLSNSHSIYRYVREAVWTDLVDYKYQRNNAYIYKGGYREVVGAWSYEGIVGSDGTA